MGLSVTCSCGRRYNVGDQLAGKIVRCKQCGQPLRIPDARVQAAPVPSDLYGLDEEPAPLPAFRRTAEPQADDRTRPRKPGAKRPTSRPSRRGRGFLGELPRPVQILVVGMLLFASFIAIWGKAKRRMAALDAGGGPPPPPVTTRQDGPKADESSRAEAQPTLPEARQGHTTKLVHRDPPGTPAPVAPPGIFRTVRFQSSVGPLAAYITPDPRDGARHPAVLWVTGGDSNTIDEGVWSEPDPQNDQTASAYRKAGIVLMFPSLRGGNDNPGAKEGFLGEVDDVLAAADFLREQPYVDPARVYLGGHSTGGTVALLAAASTSRFRAVFAFGPVHDVRGYPPQYLPFDTSDKAEVALRAPALWLHSVHCPTFVIEGTEQGNIEALNFMRARSTNPLIVFLPVQGADHFNVLDPVNRLIAQKILRDHGVTQDLGLGADELSAAFARRAEGR